VLTVREFKQFAEIRLKIWARNCTKSCYIYIFLFNFT